MSIQNQKTYFKKDFKFLTFVFLFSFVITIIFFFIGAMILHNRLYTIDIDLSVFEDPYFSGVLYANIIGIIFSDLLISSITIISISILLYEYFWLIYSKSFDYIKSNGLINIQNEIKTAKYVRISGRIFIGALSSFLFSSLVILFFVFTLRVFFLSIHVLNGPNAAFSFFSVMVIIALPFVSFGYFLFPTLIYPIVLTVENKSYISSLKRVYNLFSGKKIKLEFLLLFSILFSISFTFFGFLVIVISFCFIILRSISMQYLILFLIFFSGICSLYIVFFMEVLSNIFGNFYARVYTTLITHTKQNEQ